jgi:hypothetical protein
MDDAHTFTGQIRAEVERQRMTHAGSTPTASIAHCLYDIDAAKTFCSGVLGVQVMLDEMLGKSETDKLLSRPFGAWACTASVAGNHLFGKIALDQHLNYSVAERVDAAKSPNIAYLAQGITVDSLAMAAAGLTQAGITCIKRPAPRMQEFVSDAIIQLRSLVVESLPIFMNGVD